MLRGSEELEKGPWDPSLRELERLTREPEGLRAGSGPVEGKKIKEGGWGRGRGLRACRRQGPHPPLQNLPWRGREGLELEPG